MLTGLLYVLLLFLLFWLVTWIGLKLLFSWLSRKVRKKFSIKLSVSKIHFSFLEGLTVEKEGLFKLQIEQIGVSSSWINSNCNKPLTLLVGVATISLMKLSPEEKQNKTKGNVKKDIIPISTMTANSIRFLLQHVGVVFQNFSVTWSFCDIATNWTADVKLGIVTDTDLQRLCFKIELVNCKLTTLQNETPLLFISHNAYINSYIAAGKPIRTMTHNLIVSNFKMDINEDFFTILKLLRKKHREPTEGSGKLPENPDFARTEGGTSEVLNNLPEIIKVSLENAKIVYRLNDRRELQVDWNCVLSWQRFAGSKYKAAIDILGFIVNGRNHCKLLLCKQVTSKIDIFTETETSTNHMCVFCKVDTCHLDFIAEEILFWKKHFMGIKNRYSSIITSSRDAPLPQNVKRETFLSSCVLDGNVMFENCSCDVYFALDEALGSSVSTLYLGNFKMEFTEGSLNEKTAIIGFDINDVYCYVNIEDIPLVSHCAMPCQLEDDEPACLPTSERHAWGRVFEIGKISLNLDMKSNVTNCKMTVTYVAVEWSLSMGQSVLYIFRNLKNSLGQSSSHATKKNSLNVDLICDLENINLFIVGDKEGGYNSLLYKVDAVNLVGKNQLTFLSADTCGMVFTQLTELQRLKTGDTFYCCKANTFNDNLFAVPATKISYDNSQNTSVKNADISINQLDIDWNANIHMAFYEQINDIRTFLDCFKKQFPGKTDSQSSISRPAISVTVVVPKTKLRMRTAKSHSFGINLGSLSVVLNEQKTKFDCNEMSVYFDDAEIIRLQETQISKLSPLQLLDERRQFKSIEQHNMAWCISVDSVFINFPYRFDFGKSLDKFQVVIKFLKKLHKKPKDSDSMEALPADFLISCENLSIEFDDDPFEAKINDNYLLLSDEIEQAIEREQKLEAKLNQIKSEKGALLSGKKLDELRRNLKEKNSQIYITRSKEMYEERSPRKTLFLVGMRSIELAVLADESLHGQENVIKHLKAVDSDSPFPDDIQFTTSWCRMVLGKFDILKMLIRDYPQPLLSIETFTTKGMVIGTEACGVSTATREASLEIGAPWNDEMVIRNMPALKFYYDLKWDMSNCQVAWGANFEPTFSMVSQSFGLLSKDSVDPSPPLPFWDKIRLLFHGNLKADVADFNILLSASIDPYNTTETLEVEWSAVTLEWTNGNITIDGDYDMFTHTASKYDDSKVVHFPALKMCFQMEWLCEGDCNDHHNVYPTNPKHITNENHDSYALFRSVNLNMNVTLQTSTDHSKEQIENDPPLVFLYASTFRWFQNYQAVVISRVSRPIRRGRLFQNTKPRKPTLSRHYKLVGIELKFPSLNVTYWGSFQQEVGFETCISSGSLSVAYQVFISPHPDATLIRRPVANWIIRGLNSVLKKTRASLLQSMERELDYSEFSELLCFKEQDSIMKHYLFSVDKVEYKRQSAILEDSFTHRILLHSFKGTWTAINRELVVELFEAYSKMQKLKNVLSSEALKSTTEVNEVNKKERSRTTSTLDTSNTKSPLTRLQSGLGASLLQQLVSEQSSKFIAQSEEDESGEVDLDVSTDEGEDSDIIQRNWHIELINSQVLLHGTETKGAIIVTSGNATILRRLHLPLCATTDVVTKLNKVSWCGKFRNLQYFSTMNEFKDLTVDNIPWLTHNIIVGEASEDAQAAHSLSSFTRTSDAVGAFVEVQVHRVSYQLQRVISRCECEFCYVSLDDELDPVAEEYVPSTPQASSESIANTVSFANTLSIKHGKLEMSTSTTQYAVIADICQNLILYAEPKKKEEQDKLEKMKFKLQLTTGQDLKGNVLQLQTRVRDTLSSLRRYERNLFDYKRKEEEIKEVQREDSSLLIEIQEVLTDLHEQIEVTKEQLFEDAEELKTLISAYKAVQQMSRFSPSPQKGVSYIRKQIDILFDDLQWLLTQQDGQLGIANVFIRKFKYNQLNYKDDRLEHCCEVGHFAVKNLLPNETYREALIPHEVNIRRHLDKSVMLRIYCRVSPAVAGINVKEHFEVNVCPIAVRLTYKLFVNLESFLFPKTNTSEAIEHVIDFQPGVQAPGTSTDETKENNKADSATSKVPPPRPPPPQRPPPPRITLQKVPAPQRQLSKRKSSLTSLKDVDGEPKKKISQGSQSQGASETVSSPPSTPTSNVQPKSASFKRTSFKETFSSADRDVNTMKERASKNQTFIYVKIPEVPVCFSYKGEKERNIEDAHDFNLCLPTLEYHSRTWTWQDLFQAMKKDYTQTLVPQILKEKLHLKSAGADTKPSIAQVDDTNKAKLLFGEKPTSSQKKSAKKVLFGKLLKSGKSVSNEKLSEQSISSSTNKDSTDSLQELSGKGVEPTNLEHAFNRLRDFGEQS